LATSEWVPFPERALFLVSLADLALAGDIFVFLDAAFRARHRFGILARSNEEVDDDVPLRVIDVTRAAARVLHRFGIDPFLVGADFCAMFFVALLGRSGVRNEGNARRRTTLGRLHLRAALRPRLQLLVLLDGDHDVAGGGTHLRSCRRGRRRGYRGNQLVELAVHQLVLDTQFAVVGNHRGVVCRMGKQSPRNERDSDQPSRDRGTDGLTPAPGSCGFRHRNPSVEVSVSALQAGNVVGIRLIGVSHDMWHDFLLRKKVSNKKTSVFKRRVGQYMHHALNVKVYSIL